jgi:hypothetical protein
MDLALLDEKAMALDKGKKKKSGFSKKKKDKDKDKDAQQPLYLFIFSLPILQIELFYPLNEFDFLIVIVIVIVFDVFICSCRRRPPVIPLELPKFTPRQTSLTQVQGMSSTTSNVPVARPKFGVALPGMNPGVNP